MRNMPDMGDISMCVLICVLICVLTCVLICLLMYRSGTCATRPTWAIFLKISCGRTSRRCVLTCVLVCVLVCVLTCVLTCLLMCVLVRFLISEDRMWSYVAQVCPYMCPCVCPYMCPYMCPDICPYMCAHPASYHRPSGSCTSVSLYVSLYIYMCSHICPYMCSYTCAHPPAIIGHQVRAQPQQGLPLRECSQGASNSAASPLHQWLWNPRPRWGPQAPALGAHG